MHCILMRRFEVPSAVLSCIGIVWLLCSVNCAFAELACAGSTGELFASVASTGHASSAFVFIL